MKLLFFIVPISRYSFTPHEDDKLEVEDGFKRNHVPLLGWVRSVGKWIIILFLVSMNSGSIKYSQNHIIHDFPLYYYSK